MILLPLLCLLTGAGLGYYFQVYVLIPAAPLALMAVVGEGFASDVGLWWILLDASVAALALQIGYIAEAFCTYVERPSPPPPSD